MIIIGVNESMILLFQAKREYDLTIGTGRGNDFIVRAGTTSFPDSLYRQTRPSGKINTDCES